MTWQQYCLTGQNNKWQHCICHSRCLVDDDDDDGDDDNNNINDGDGDDDGGKEKGNL